MAQGDVVQLLEQMLTEMQSFRKEIGNVQEQTHTNTQLGGAHMFRSSQRDSFGDRFVYLPQCSAGPSGLHGESPRFHEAPIPTTSALPGTLRHVAVARL